MPFLPFVVLLAWQALSKSASFALGWATALYFGQVPGKQGRVVAVMSLASAAWIIVLAGFAVPLLIGALLDWLGIISRNFSVARLHVLGLTAAIALTPPAVAAAAVWGEFHGRPSVGDWLRLLPISYPATASLGLGVAQMVVFAPVLVVRRLIRKQTMLQTALSMREDADDEQLTRAVATALSSIGLRHVEAEEARGFLAWPMRTVGFATRHLLGAVVRGDPMILRADGLRLLAYATNVAVLGESRDAHRARAALERQLPFSNARITWSEDARALEDELMEAHRAANGDGEATRRRLAAIQERIDAASLDVEEWNVLYRLRLQVEQAAAVDETDHQPGTPGPAALSGRTSGSRSRRP